MKKITLTIVLIEIICTFSNTIFAQSCKYDNYLKKNNLSVASSDIIFVDSINLHDNCKIKFSQDDTCLYADLITKDTIVQISVADLNNHPKKWIGGLCADFDSCFFWGNAVNHIMYGNIIYKTKPLFRVDTNFIYLDANEQQGILLLAHSDNDDANYKSVFIYNVKTGVFTTYDLKRKIWEPNLWYIRLVSITKDNIILKNVIDNKLLYGTIKK